ncbi:hypothetical protein SRHO_G00294040 [Serrasalmus rhombeus]
MVSVGIVEVHWAISSYKGNGGVSDRCYCNLFEPARYLRSHWRGNTHAGDERVQIHDEFNRWRLSSSRLEQLQTDIIISQTAPLE